MARSQEVTDCLLTRSNFFPTPTCFGIWLPSSVVWVPDKLLTKSTTSLSICWSFTNDSYLLFVGSSAILLPSAIQSTHPYNLSPFVTFAFLHTYYFLSKFISLVLSSFFPLNILVHFPSLFSWFLVYYPSQFWILNFLFSCYIVYLFLIYFFCSPSYVSLFIYFIPLFFLIFLYSSSFSYFYLLFIDFFI
jgi:hypothetical protein